MKKIMMLILSLTIIFTLVSCGKEGAKDETSAFDEFNTAVVNLTDVYNDIAQLAMDNGWEADKDTLTELNSVADTIEEFQLIMDDKTIWNEKTEEEQLAIMESITELVTSVRLVGDKVAEPF